MGEDQPPCRGDDPACAPLARALYFYGAIGREIPEQLYTAVAVILAHVWRLEQGQPEPTPDVDVPAALSVDEFGRRQQRT